ncbi:MAG: hypothetical protein NTV97_33930 [Alphaproteobacteria bacterium]|nr:hypothetical protein [Alphaproteobacteria bacterium]
MPEDQKPFVHQDGSTTPSIDKPATLSVGVLSNLINHMSHARAQNALGDQRTREARQAPYDQIIAILRLLKHPSLNSAVVALGTLEPADASVVVDVAMAVMEAGTAKRAKLIRALRVALEIRS